MFLFFGLMGQKAKYKGTVESLCSQCGYSRLFPLYAGSNLLVLFFIPIPIFSEAYIVCPRCGYIKKLNRSEYLRFKK